jgi:hypothetical protein
MLNIHNTFYIKKHTIMAVYKLIYGTGFSLLQKNIDSLHEKYDHAPALFSYTF